MSGGILWFVWACARCWVCVKRGSKEGWEDGWECALRALSATEGNGERVDCKDP